MTKIQFLINKEKHLRSYADVLEKDGHRAFEYEMRRRQADAVAAYRSELTK